MAFGFRSKQQVQASPGSQYAPGMAGFGTTKFAPRWASISTFGLEIAPRAPYDIDYRPPESLVGSLIINRRQIEGTAQGRMMQVYQGIGLLDVGGYSLAPAGMIVATPLSDTDSPPFGMPLIGSPYLNQFSTQGKRV